VASLVAFFLYLQSLYAPVQNLSAAWEAIQSSLAGADRLADLIAEPHEPQNRHGPEPVTNSVSGEIIFKDVSFVYTPGAPVLEHISLNIPAKSVVALVGPTGMGKTTLVSPIPRLYDVSNDSITLDGHDLRDFTLESLRKQISIVLKDIFLFYGTVRENLLFGQSKAGEAEMVATRAVNAYEFIMELSEGYETVIDERGI